MLNEHTEHAARYRRKANEIRRSAADMKGDSRRTLLQLARDYDLLADKRDLAAARLHEKSSSH